MNHVIHIESGTFRIQGSDIATYVNRSDELVEIETRIPPDAKAAVKDFLKETFQDIVESTTELAIEIPEHLLNYSEIIIEIVKTVIGS